MLAPLSAEGFRPARKTIVKLALAAVLVALGVQILRFMMGDLLSGADPGLALAFDSTQAAARLTVLEGLLEADRKKVDEAAAGARDVLGVNPLSAQALTLLAIASKLKGDDRTTAHLMDLAGRTDLRSLSAELWLLDDDLRNSHADAALRRIDALMRGQPWQVIDALGPSLAAIVSREPYRYGYVKLLRQNPPWRQGWFPNLLQRGNDLEALSYLFAELQSGENGPTDRELNVFLNRLTEAQMFDEAHDVWLRSLSSDQREQADRLYNAQFQFPVTNLPFDWVMKPVPRVSVHVDAERSKPILAATFFGGRLQSEPVSHLLSLAPGGYRFLGWESSQSLKTARGLRWRIFCMSEADKTLAATETLVGDTAWRTFGVDFVVPADGCAYQELVLETPARTALESEILGQAFYSELDIRAK